jgi:hypothetical protein
MTLDISTWAKECKRAVRSMDVKKFRDFYNKRYQMGLYVKPLPANDHVIEISMRKMLLALHGIPQEETESAKKWLIDHGYSLSLDKVGRGL